MSAGSSEPEPSAVERWNDLVVGGPAASAPDAALPSPWSTRWAREVLPPSAGTVLHVGCGAGGASLALVPPASELIGVDVSGAALDEFVAAASAAGVARRTIHGEWPEIAAFVPTADLVLCDVAWDRVGDVAPFVVALTAHARLAVVTELPTRHASAGPSAVDLTAVLRELGLDPEITESPGGVTTLRWPGEAPPGP